MLTFFEVFSSDRSAIRLRFSIRLILEAQNVDGSKRTAPRDNHSPLYISHILHVYSTGWKEGKKRANAGSLNPHLLQKSLM